MNMLSISKRIYMKISVMIYQKQIGMQTYEEFYI